MPPAVLERSANVRPPALPVAEDVRQPVRVHPLPTRPYAAEAAELSIPQLIISVPEGPAQIDRQVQMYDVAPSRSDTTPLTRVPASAAADGTLDGLRPAVFLGQEPRQVAPAAEPAAVEPLVIVPEPERHAVDPPVMVVNIEDSHPYTTLPELGEYRRSEELDKTTDILNDAELYPGLTDDLAVPLIEIQTVSDRLEAVYFGGELVVSRMFADEDEIEFDITAGPDGPETVEANAAREVITIAAIVDTERFAAAMPQLLERQLEHYVASVEPEQMEAAELLIDTLTLAAQNSKQLPEAAIEQQLLAEQAVEELCRQLLDCLGAEPTDEAVRWLMRAVTIQESETVDAPDNEERLSIDELNALGTYEYQQDDGTPLHRVLTRFLQQKILPRLFLGRCALQLT